MPLIVWTNEQIDSVNAVLIPKGRHQRQVELPPSPHGTLPNGLADFRRFPLTRAAGIIIADADFSQARSPLNEYGVDESIHLTWMKCDRVTFDQARSFHCLNGRFESCSFRRIGTDHCSFTGRYFDCDFSGTSFRTAHLSANFVRCKFHDCRMKLASWGSSFEDCEFAGATIDDVFADIRDVALAASQVTFVVVSGKPRPGETRHIS